MNVVERILVATVLAVNTALFGLLLAVTPASAPRAAFLLVMLIAGNVTSLVLLAPWRGRRS